MPNAQTLKYNLRNLLLTYSYAINKYKGTNTCIIPNIETILFLLKKLMDVKLTIARRNKRKIDK